MKKIFILLLVFFIGDCVQLTRCVWWSIGNWKIIKIEKTGCVIYGGEWTVHDVPEKMLRKCK